MTKKCEKIDKCNRGNNCITKTNCCELNLYEFKQWAIDKDFDMIVDKAFYIDGSKKRYSHQYCIKSTAYEDYRKKVKELKAEISNAKYFDEILEFLTLRGVKKNFEHINGIGELTEYDIALRIGACYGIYPQKVYLHAGTREGAKRIGIKTYKRKYLEISELPKWLQVVEPHLIEDFLCICKDCLSEDSLKSKECLKCYYKYFSQRGVSYDIQV